MFFVLVIEIADGRLWQTLKGKNPSYLQKLVQKIIYQGFVVNKEVSFWLDTFWTNVVSILGHQLLQAHKSTQRTI